VLDGYLTDSAKSVWYNEMAYTAQNTKQQNLQALYADSAYFYAIESNNHNLIIQSLLSSISLYQDLKDTTKTRALFNEGFALIEARSIQENPVVIAFRLEYIEYQIRQEQITSEDGIARCLELYALLAESENYELLTAVVGRISLLYRNRKKIGEALKYNRLEQQYAEKSNLPREVAAAMITELDLSFQLLPKPSNPQYTEPLIQKAKTAELYMKENNILDILPFAQLYLAKFYFQEEDYDQSKAVLFSIIDSTSSDRIVFSKYESLCSIAKNTNDLASYKNYLFKFKPAAYRTKRPFVALNVHNYLVDYFTKTDQQDSAVFYATKLQNNLAEVDTTQFLDYVYFSYNVLSAHYQGIDDDKSYRFKNYATKVNEHIVARQKEVLIDMIYLNDNLADLQKENTNLNSDLLFFKNNSRYILVLSFILLGFLIFVSIKYKKNKESTQLAEQEKKEILKSVEKTSLILNNKQKIYLDEIEYIKADRNYVEFFTTAKKIKDRNSLSMVFQKLPPNFIQVHRSYVINTNYIISKGTNILVMKSSAQVPISRTYKKNLD